jgi:hypothetical protein
LVYNDFLDYKISAKTWEKKRQRLYKRSLIIKIKQEIKQEIKDSLDKEQVKKLLSNIESKAESYMSNNRIVSQDDFVFF